MTWIVLWEFEHLHHRKPLHGHDDFALLKDIRNQLMSSHGLPESFVADAFLEVLQRNASLQLTPVCAIVGGWLAQECIKVLSRKDAPFRNLLLYNGQEGSAIAYLLDGQSQPY
jgi:ubiquitin-like 1-activating enzyme E1 A